MFVLSTVNDLKTFLVKEASRKKLITPPQYIEKEINICDLQLSDSFPDPRDTNQVQNQISNISLNHLFKKHQPSNSTFVALVGAGGSGKTTFSKQILDEYSKTNTFFGIEYLFYMRFSDIDLNCKSNLLQFLASTFPYQWLLNNTTCANVLKKIIEKSKLCIIIDGFNTKNINFPNPVLPLPKPEAIFSGATHLVNILSGNALPGATVIATFRPNQLLGLPTALKPHLVVNILGLKQKNQEEISKNLLISSTEVIVMYIDAYPQLKNFCSVPENCLAVMHIINEFCLSEEVFNPLTCFPLAQIFVSSFALLFLDKSLKYSQCNLFCAVERAWGYFSDKSLNFHEENINKIHVCEIIEIFFQLLPPKCCFSGYEVCFYSICQNFFIAVGLLYFDKKDCKTLNKYVEKWLKSQILDATQDFREITRFLFGLCNIVVFDYIKQLLPSFPLLGNQSKILTDCVIAVFSNEKNDQLKDFSTLLFVSSLAFEMQNNSFTKKLANTCFPDKIYVSDNCSFREIVAFLYVLQARTTNLIVYGTSCFTEEIKKFVTNVEQVLINVSFKLV